MFLLQRQFEKVQPSTFGNKFGVTSSSVTEKVKKLQSRSYGDADLKCHLSKR
jgi:Mn-dependent DtxR family transcriptional regulator